MAAQELKRLEVKYIRDRAKSAYPSKLNARCAICDTKQDIQFHHYVGVSNLWNAFKKKHKIKITSVEDIEIYRDRFISVHATELYDKGVFLCKKHHKALHNIYGVSPVISTASKQARWVEKQKAKYNGDTENNKRKA